MTIKWNDAKFKKAVKAEGVKRLLKAGFIIEAMAKKIVPYDTGRLRASISTNVTGGPSQGKVGREAKGTKGIAAPITPFTVVVGSNVEYAPAQELGTSRTTAQPFLRPALWGSLSTIKRIMNK